MYEMEPQVVHEYSAHERHVYGQIVRLTEAANLGEPNISRAAWEQIDLLLDHLHDLGHVAVEGK